MASIGCYRIGGLVPVAQLFAASKKLGDRLAEVR
jgi:hypothetical protein